MSIRKTFSNSIDLSEMNEYDQDAVMQISTVLGHVCHVVFRVDNFGNTKSMRVMFFLKMFQIRLI